MGNKNPKPAKKRQEKIELKSDNKPNPAATQAQQVEINLQRDNKPNPDATQAPQVEIILQSDHKPNPAATQAPQVEIILQSDDKPNPAGTKAPQADLALQINKLKKSNNKFTWIIVVLCLLILALLIFLLVSVFQTVSPFFKSGKVITDMPICNRPNCQDAAEFIKVGLNLKADPCKDIYYFVCGNFPEQLDKRLQPQLDDIIVKSTDMPLRGHHPDVKFVERFMHSCEEKVTGEGVELLIDYVNDLGGMPLISGKKYEPHFTWWERQAKLISKFSYYDNHFSLGQVFSLAEPSNYTRIHLMKMEDWHDFLFYDFQNSYENVTKFYTMVICEIMKSKCSKKQKQDTITQIGDIVKLELILHRLANASGSPKDMSVADLESEIPTIKWNKLLNATLGREYDLNTIVEGVYVDYFKNISSVFEDIGNPAVANYFGFYLIQQFLPFVMDYAKYNNMSKLSETKEDACWDVVQKNFPVIYNRLFVEEAMATNVSLEDIHNVTIMIRNIQKAMIGMVQEKKWLDARTKEAAIVKLRDLDSVVGFQEWIMNDKALHKYYKPIMDHAMTPFLPLLKNVMSYSTKEALYKFGHPLYKPVIDAMSTYEANTLYENDSNTINIALASMFPPVYWLNGVQAVNYGILGQAIGREISHSLDRGNIYLDAYGNPANWFSRESEKAYLERTECLARQYNTFFYNSNLTLDDREWVRESECDNAGLRAAYKAYMASGLKRERLPGLEQFNDRQLFFIAYVASYCNNSRTEEEFQKDMKGQRPTTRLRATIPIVNFEEFAKVFHCPEGTWMNPKDRCVIW